MPIPQFDAKLNFIVNYFWNGCRPPFFLLVECAKVPAWTAALALADVGLDDIVRSFMRPKGLRSSRHGRKGSRKGAFGGIPELSEVITQRIDTDGEIRRRDVSQGVKQLWWLDNIVQRGIYEVSILDITNDFLYGTLLGTLRLRPTQCDVAGRVSCYGKDLDAPNNGQRYSIPWFGLDYVEYPATYYSYEIGLAAPMQGQVIVEATTVGIGTRPGNGIIWIELETPKGKSMYRHDIRGLAPGAVDKAFFSISTMGPLYVRAWYQYSNNLTLVDSRGIIVPDNGFFGE